jgi:hypothetical protein
MNATTDCDCYHHQPLVTIAAIYIEAAGRFTHRGKGHWIVYFNRFAALFKLL